MGIADPDGGPGGDQQQSALTPPERRELQENPPVASTRIKLNDGRHLAYIEKGVPKSRANYKIVVVHGFGSSKEMNFPVSPEVAESLGLYIVLYDRAGYGDSDYNPKRSLRSEAQDVAELADWLQLGSKFYIIGVSMGSYPTWSCIKHIPHRYRLCFSICQIHYMSPFSVAVDDQVGCYLLCRLAGVAFIAPTVNYRWPSLPERLTKPDYRRRLIRWSIRIASHAPGLLQWFVTTKYHPSDGDPSIFNKRDIEALKKNAGGFPMFTPEKLRERLVFETLRGDFKTGFGKWDFDPLELVDPLQKEDRPSVHIWHGYEDKVVPHQLQRYISSKLPWIKYHEIPDGGHLIIHYQGVCDAILKSLLTGEEPPVL